MSREDREAEVASDVARLGAELEAERRRREQLEAELEHALVAPGVVSAQRRQPPEDSERDLPDTVPGGGPPGTQCSPQRRTEALRRREEALSNAPERRAGRDPLRSPRAVGMGEATTSPE
ncbi:MAG: hypothetical protein ABR529_04760 [Actinomycetota bacterium]